MRIGLSLPLTRPLTIGQKINQSNMLRMKNLQCDTLSFKGEDEDGFIETLAKYEKRPGSLEIREIFSFYGQDADPNHPKMKKAIKEFKERNGKDSIIVEIFEECVEPYIGENLK